MTKQLQHLLEKVSQGADLNPERRRALEAFNNLGLPAFRSENYQRTDLSAMFDESWTLGSKDYSPTPHEGLQYFQLLPPEGEINLPSTEQEPLAQLAKVLAPASGYLHIPKGIKLQGAIHITGLLNAQSPTLSPERLVIVLEDEAEAELVFTDKNEGSSLCLSLQCVEIQLGRGAKLRYTDIEQSGSLARRIATLHLRAEVGSEAHIHSFCISAGQTRNNFYCDLQGEGAHLNLGGLVLTSDKEHVDNYSFIAHSVPHCTSNELFKYVLRGQSYGIFTGRILVAQDAQKTEAYQNNRNLLLSADARMQAKPQLEIYADDVRCSHGMTTGQLDENALFYMRQRGIRQDEAKRMLSIAFAEEVIQLLPDEALQADLRQLIEQRL